ncbi:hypothetical protein [Streptomyces pluripotens]|uniref:hypothetical protein n=1 Tax=Streptomyces pluripotens TaxID=1355015 RepID=UPI000A673FA2|nr:hypothetical protein [Streptomyces pluripotens]
MAKDEPSDRLPSSIFDAVEVHYEDLPVSEIEATGQGIPSTLFAPSNKIAEWDNLEQNFEDLSRRIKEQVASDVQGTFRQLEEQIREVAYEPSYVGGELDRKNLRMYEWQRGELYIHSAALILDPETTLEVTYEPEGRLKRLLLESEDRSISYLGELPDGVSPEQGNAVAVWRAQKGKSATAANDAEFLDDLSEIYLEPFREALATRRRFINEYSIEPHRIRLSYDDQPYDVNYSQTKFRRSHIHALPVIRQSPLDAREAMVAAMRGTGEYGLNREARARAVVDRVTQGARLEAASASPSKYALLWVRDNRDQGAFMDTKPEILKQTIETLRSTEPDRKIFLVGDDLFQGHPELYSAFQEEGVLDGVDTETLIRFWAADKNNGKALTHGEQALFLHYLNTDVDLVQIGIESGALESAICLGVPTVYFQAREHVGDKGTRWQLYWAQWSFGESRVAEEADGSKKFFASGRPVKHFSRSGEVYPPPLMSVRRVEFGPDLPDPEDKLAEPITVYYPAKITVGIDQISNLVKSGELLDMAGAFDQGWSGESWRTSEYYADQINRWAHVDTTDWEVAARRYEAITHALNGVVHPTDAEVRRTYESAGYHLDGQHGQGPGSTAARDEISAAYRTKPQDRGTSITAALNKVLSDEGFKARCVHDLRLARLSTEEQAKLASSVKEVTAANNVLRALGNRAPDGSPTTSKHIAEALRLPTQQNRVLSGPLVAEAAPPSLSRRAAAARSHSTAAKLGSKPEGTARRHNPEDLGPDVPLRTAPEASNPLALLGDDDLTQLQANLTNAAQALTDRAATSAGTAQALADRYERDGGDIVARLTAAGAEPHLIERARASAAEDLAHARSAAQASQNQLNDINSRIQQAAQEAERRAGLTPQQRQAEEAIRQEHAAQRPTRHLQVPRPGPKITGPEGPSRGGASL